jgi:hypothetical protein
MLIRCSVNCRYFVVSVRTYSHSAKLTVVDYTSVQFRQVFLGLFIFVVVEPPK